MTSLMSDAGLFWARNTGPNQWTIVTPPGGDDRTAVYDSDTMRFVLDDGTDHATLMDVMVAIERTL